MNLKNLYIFFSFTKANHTEIITQCINQNDSILLEKFVNDSLLYVDKYSNTNINYWYDRLLKIFSKMYFHDFVESFISDYDKIKHYVRDKEDLFIFDIKHENFDQKSFLETYQYLSIASVSLFEISKFTSKYHPMAYNNLSMNILQIECHESIKKILDILRDYSQMCYNLRSLYFLISHQNNL
jgi:hypothetical protein